MNDLEIIKFQPSKVKGSRQGHRLANKWLTENGDVGNNKKVMFEGNGKQLGRTVHFAVLRGLTEDEVQSLYRQKKSDLADGVIFYWSYFAIDDPKQMPKLINDGLDGFNSDLLDETLFSVGEGDLFQSQIFGGKFAGMNT